MITMLPRDDDGKLSVYVWPGGYPLAYYTEDGGTLCPACARMAENEKLTDDPQWAIEAASVLWEDPETCDHCGAVIPSAYGEEV